MGFEKLKRVRTLKECFISYSNTSSSLKNSAEPPSFNLLLSVWISNETLFLVFEILLKIFMPVAVGAREEELARTLCRGLLCQIPLQILHLLLLSFIQMVCFPFLINYYCGVHVNYFDSQVYLHYVQNIDIF